MRFGFGDTEYEIDLNRKDAATFRQELAPFIEHARKARSGQYRRAARTTGIRRRSSDILAQVKDQNIAVS